MAKKKISAKTSKVEGRVFEGEVELHDETLDTLIEWIGVDAVRTNAVANIVIEYQSLIRACIEKGKSDAEIQAIIDAKKPGVKASLGPADPVESVMKKFNTMTPEEQLAFQKDLIERLKKARAA